MKTMKALSPPGPPRLWAGGALVISTLAMMLIPVSANAAPEPPAAPAAPPLVRELREPRSGAGPLARGYKSRWGYGPGPVFGRDIGFERGGAPRWLVGLLVLLAAALAVALTGVLLKNRARSATGGGAQQILERRLAEGAIDVEDFEQRRDALGRKSREPS